MLALRAHEEIDSRISFLKITLGSRFSRTKWSRCSTVPNSL